MYVFIHYINLFFIMYTYSFKKTHLYFHFYYMYTKWRGRALYRKLGGSLFMGSISPIKLLFISRCIPSTASETPPPLKTLSFVGGWLNWMALILGAKWSMDALGKNGMYKIYKLYKT